MAWRAFKTAPYRYLFRILIAVFVLGFGIFWVLKIRNIQRLKIEVAQMETKLVKGQEVWRTYPPLTPLEKKGLQRAQERLFHMLPKDKDIPSLLQEISRLAQEYNLVDVSFNTADGTAPSGTGPVPPPGGAAPAVVVPNQAPAVSPAVSDGSKPVESFPIKVAFSADYREIAYFLEALRKLPRLVTIQSLRVQKGVPLLPVEVVLHAYYQKGDLAVGGK